METLRARGDCLPNPVREALNAVALCQGDRLTWMAAALELGSRPETGRRPEWVLVAEVAAEAGRRAGVEVEGLTLEGSPSFCDRHRLGVALEGLLLALGEDQPGASARMAGPNLVVSSPLGSLEDDGRRWKLLLAGHLLEEEGCPLNVHHDGEGTRAEVRFGPATRESA